MTDTMRAAWARLRRPRPRPPAGGAQILPFAEHATTHDPFTMLQSVVLQDTDEEGEPLTGYETFLALKYTEERARRAFCTSDEAAAAGDVEAWDALRERELRRELLGAQGKLEGGSGPGVMGTDNGPDVRFDGPA